MSRYLPTYRSRFVCVCATSRLVPLAPLPLLLFTRARRTHIPGGAPRPAARTYLITGCGGQRARSVSMLSGTGCCQPTTMSYRRPVFLTRTWMRVRRVICRLISPGCAISAALTLDVLCGEALRLNWRRFLLINCSCIVKFIRWEREREREREREMCVF